MLIRICISTTKKYLFERKIVINASVEQIKNIDSLKC